MLLRKIIAGAPPKYDDNRRNSATISFIAKSASMVPVPDPSDIDNAKRLKSGATWDSF